MNYTRVIIEDLQEKQAIDITDSYQYRLSKINIAAEHKLSELVPRDNSVWTKTAAEKAFLKKCKYSKYI